MLGFFTLVSLVVAYALGGWWWAGFVFMFLAWLGKRQEAKEQLAKSETEQTLAQIDAAIANTSSAGLMDEWPPELIDACSALTSHGYYVGDLIPEKKRAAAMENYPLPGDGEILALIDGTVFGSAAKGLAVGEDGIAWKNGSDQPVKILWSYLARSDISSGDYKVSVGTLKFDNSGSGIKLEEVEKFLLRLKSYALAVTSNDEEVVRDGGKAIPKVSQAANVSKPVVAINRAEFDELLVLPGIGAAEAQMIIKRRSEQSFTSTAEMADYLDLKPHLVAKLEGLTDFEPALAASVANTDAAKQTVGIAPKPSVLGGRTID